MAHITKNVLPHPLRVPVERYLNYLAAEQNRALTTVAIYRKSLNMFLRFNPPSRVEDISSATVRAYKLFLRRHTSRKGQNLKSTTINVYLVALRGFLRYVAVHEDRETLPPGKIELLSVGDRPVKVLTEEQVEELLQAPIGSNRRTAVRDRAILELLFSTGARVSELTQLNRDDVNLKTREMSISGKRRKIRVVFITDTASEALSEYLATRKDQYAPLFIRTSGPRVDDVTEAGEKFRLSPKSVWEIVHRYAREAGLVSDPSPHTLRHTLATILLRRGADLRSVQEILGHKDISTTQIYTHVTNPQLKSVHKKYHPRNR